MNPKFKCKTELLAPAGTKDAFWAAVEAKADAIYVSPKILNARAYGKNFSISEIADLTETAHKKGIKIFVALNSNMKESEIKECIKILAQLDEIGPDALIIQDLGILRLARTFFPNLRLHASTLMAIHNSKGVEVAHKLGFSRVVLARELTLGEIESIARKNICELEIFIHGAMCFSISGLCLFSSYFGGKSSLRGKCVQPCRRLYTWNGIKGTYFSMDDLCGIDVVPKLKKIGVSSLKIEGRLKPANYIFNVVRAYRYVLDADNNNEKERIKLAKDLLQKAMGRPVTSGFFFNQNPSGIISPTRSANTGLYIGKISSISKDNFIKIDNASSDITQGDKIRIVIKDIDEQFSAVIADKDSESNTFKPSHIPSHLKNKISGALLFKIDSSANISLSSEIVLENFKNKEKRLKNAVIKGQKIFESLNRKKRQDNQGKKKSQETEIYLSLKDVRLLDRLSVPNTVKGIFIELNSINFKAISKMRLKKALRSKIIWALRPVIFEYELKKTENLIHQAIKSGFNQFRISNIGHLSYFPRKAKLYSSHHIGALNSQALTALKELGVDIPHFSIETDLENLKDAVANFKPSPLLTVYGYLPIFTTRLRHKIYSSKTHVISPKGEKFFWKNDDNVGLLYPERPISMTGHFKDLFSAGIFRFVINLEFFPKKIPRFLKIPATPSGLASKFKGRAFNLKGHLL